MSTPRDPRDIVTPDAFTVAPELLGLPLARPSRRAAAMLVDLLIVVIMIKAISFTLFVLAAALLLFRVAKPSATGGVLRRSAAWGVRIGAIVLLGVFGTLVVRRVIGFIDEPRITVASGADAQADSISFGLSDLKAIGFISALQKSHDAAGTRVVAQEIASWIRERSNDPAERQATARLILGELGGIEYRTVLEQELQPFTGVAATALSDGPDVTPLRAYVDAVERNDTAEAARLLDDARTAIAGDRIAELESSRRRLSGVTDSLEAALEHEREARGVRRFLAGLADDFGVGFGWMAVYFTAFVVLWNGQTPGKRLLGVRIIRLDAKPLSWWLAFERFGGYAASFSTGLLGFAQILWDRNRQGMHDKFIETVVIRESAAPEAAPRQPGRSASRPRQSAPPGSRPRA